LEERWDFLIRLIGRYHEARFQRDFARSDEAHKIFQSGQEKEQSWEDTLRELFKYHQKYEGARHPLSRTI
jgi:hypothetical protein